MRSNSQRRDDAAHGSLFFLQVGLQCVAKIGFTAE